MKLFSSETRSLKVGRAVISPMHLQDTLKMKIICRKNKIDDSFTPDTVSSLKRYISIGNNELDIEPGKEYVVYGIEFWDNCPWLYICSESYHEYPKPYASDFFEISDNKLSSQWILKSRETHNHKNKTQLVFPEWADDESFYEKLIDENKTCIDIFKKHRKIMDTE
jgi:hypothetical protein